MDTDALLALIREHFGSHYQRGKLFHIHRNHIPFNGGFVHLRVMVQEVPPPTHQADDISDNMGHHAET